MPIFNLMSKRSPTAIWTASDYTESALNELPSIALYEYEQTYSQLLQSINYWVKKIEGGAKDAYKGLYVAKKTPNEYILPFFTQFNQNMQQKWEESKGPLGDYAKSAFDIIETVAKAFKPTAGIIYPKSWAGSNEGSFEFSFDLLNTVHAGDYVQNRFFLETFIGQNLHVQNDFLTITPPCLYEVFIPGIRWSPVAVITSLTVRNKGTLNKIGGVIVPDAYGVEVQITELINQSRLIFQQGWESKSPANITVRAIDTSPTVITEAVQGAVNTVAPTPAPPTPTPTPRS